MWEFPPRYDFRLEDLRAWHVVEASCRRCRHLAPIAHGALLRGRTSYTQLFELERALLLRALRRPRSGVARHQAAASGVTVSRVFGKRRGNAEILCSSALSGEGRPAQEDTETDRIAIDVTPRWRREVSSLGEL